MQQTPLEYAFSVDGSLLKLNQQQKIQSAEALTGGLTNRCWKVIIDGRPYVWRPSTAVSIAFGIDRSHEYQVLRSLFKSTLSPNAIVHYPFGILVEWLEGETLAEHGNVEALSSILTRLLATLHQLPFQPQQHFSFKQRLSHYWDQLEQSNRSLTSQILYQHYMQQPESAQFDSVLCHFDLGGYNVIKNGGSYKIIDWEYATYSDPSQDLTMSILASCLDRDSAVKQYCQHRGIANTQPWLIAVEHWTPWCQLLASLWCRLGYQLNQDYSYLVQAISHEKAVLNEINEKDCF